MSFLESLNSEHSDQHLALCLEHLNEVPQDTSVWRFVLIEAVAQSRWELALKASMALRELVPVEERAALYRQEAMLWLELGERNEACRALEESQNLEPTSLEGSFYLGRLYLSLGLVSDAVTVSKHLLEVCPEAPEGFYILGSALVASGMHDMALDALKQALHFAPDCLPALLLLGQLKQFQREWSTAAFYYRELIFYARMQGKEREEDCLNAFLSLAYCLQNQGELSTALQVLQEALPLDPGQTTALSLACLSPPVFFDQEDLDNWSKMLSDGLSQVASQGADLALNQIFYPPQYWFNRGECTRPLRERVAELLSRDLNAVQDVTERAEKQRIGLLVGPSGPYFSGPLIQFLANDSECEPWCFFVGRFTQVEQLGDGVQTVSLKTDALDVISEAILDADLDILVYPALGEDPLTYLLSLQRFAPKQVLLMGRPQTSGAVSMDYFISSSWHETLTSQPHYTEKLILLDELPHGFLLPEPEMRTRKDLGLPTLGNLYLCPAPLSHIHPEFDVVLADILNRDKKAFIVFFYERDTAQHTLLQQRFSKRLPSKRLKRIRFLPRPESLVSVIAEADVVLDPPYCSDEEAGAIALLCGVPCITWESKFLPGKLVSALYRRMGLDDVPLKGLEDYAAKAFELASDSGQRAMLRERILAKNKVLLSEQRPLESLAKFLRKL